MSENILTVKDLKTYFYTASGVAKAVDGVSFNIAKGETMGIVGESGSGKSVTSSSIIRLLPPRTGKIVGGSIEFEGKDVLALSKKELNDFRGKDIAVIFQDPMTSLDPVFKIGKQMTEMITFQRALQSAAQLSKMYDQLMTKATSDVGRL